MNILQYHLSWYQDHTCPNTFLCLQKSKDLLRKLLISICRNFGRSCKLKKKVNSKIGSRSIFVESWFFRKEALILNLDLANELMLPPTSFHGMRTNLHNEQRGGWTMEHVFECSWNSIGKQNFGFDPYSCSNRFAKYNNE